MQIAFFDQSGHEAESKVVSLAVLLASEESWIQFDKEWRDALRKAEIPFFHMTDYEARQRAYSNWNNQKRISVISELAAIIKKTISFGFCNVLIVKDWKTVWGPLIEGAYFKKRLSYGFLLQGCFAAMMHWAPLKEGEPFVCVFDQDDFSMNFLESFYAGLNELHSLGLVFGKNDVW